MRAEEEWPRESFLADAEGFVILKTSGLSSEGSKRKR